MVMTQTDLFAKYSPIMEREMVNISLVVDSAMLRLEFVLEKKESANVVSK